MRVKAIARGFDGALREPGDVFTVADTMPAPTVDEKGVPLKEPLPDVPHTAKWFVPAEADDDAEAEPEVKKSRGKKA